MPSWDGYGLQELRRTRWLRGGVGPAPPTFSSALSAADAGYTTIGRSLSFFSHRRRTSLPFLRSRVGGAATAQTDNRLLGGQVDGQVATMASMDNSLYNHLCITRRHDVLHDEAHIARQLSTVRSPRSARGRRRADAEEQPVDGRFDERPEQHACPRRRERGAREQRSGY